MYILQDSESVWNSETPKLPTCFKETVLVWVPCAFIWIFATLEVFYMRKSFSRNIPWSILNILKLIVNLLLIVLAFVDLVVAIYMWSSGKQIYAVHIVTPIIKIFTFVSISDAYKNELNKKLPDIDSSLGLLQ